MLTPEEIGAWSIEELQEEIRRLLPGGSTLKVVPISEGYWIAKVERLEGEHLVVVAEEPHADLRIALLNLFGGLWLKPLETTAPSPWVRRRDLPNQITPKFEAVKDPEDLDPDSISMVYRGLR